MSDPTRARINAAFDDELSSTPVPAGLRALSVRAALSAPNSRSNHPVLLALVAGLLLVALVATLVLGSHVLRSTPTPAGSTTPPPARGSAAVAYDAARGVMVLFGGIGTPVLGDTWTWDGKYWVQRHPALSPAPRYYAAMAYDELRHETVLYGGIAGRNSYQDTWVWNGTTWHEKHPAHDPVYGYQWQAPTMALDPISRHLVMYGFTPDYKPQTWSWNGSDWTQLSTAGFANAGVVIYRDARRLLMISPSTEMVGGRYVARTMAWNGATWTSVDTPFTPSIEGFGSSAYDPGRNQLVVLAADTWTWDGSTWTRQHPTTRPASVGYMVYMPALHEVISWGDISSSLDNETYAWDGKNWNLIAPGTVMPGPDNSGKSGYSGVMTAAEATAVVRQMVTDTRPVLVPSYIPPAIFDATVSVTADSFSIRYQSDLRDKEIDFGIVVPNPPPGGTNSRDTKVRFRHALPMKTTAPGFAEYFVFDATAPDSARWLMWMEPGTMSNPGVAGQGVPYFLSADGFTDAEFWQVANSLR